MLLFYYCYLCNVYLGPPQEVSSLRRCLSDDNRLSLCWNAPHTIMGSVRYFIRADHLTENRTGMPCLIIETIMMLGTTTEQCDNTFGSQCDPYKYSVTPILIGPNDINFRGPTRSILVESKG